MSDDKSPPAVPSAAVRTGHEADHDVDVHERGAPRDGVAQSMDRRMFMQLLVFDSAPGLDPAETSRSVGASLDRHGVSAVVYADVHAPSGLAVLTWSEDPTYFVTAVRPALGDPALRMVQRPEWSMLGRTYSTGYEPDLAFWLLERPVQTVLNPAWPWAVWYPLRRTGAFNRLEPREQGAILREHGGIGRAYGAKDLAHDIRLACHGIDAHDNEFVIGLVGKDLHPLSHVVQSMRRTRQTAEFMAHMGPFFVGHATLRTTGVPR